MQTTIRKQTAFRFNSNLLEALKRNAKRENRSLNDYVENVLTDIVDFNPNEETSAAIEEARMGKSAGKLDMSSFDRFKDSINAIE